MSEQIPVNPVILKWARETSGFGIDDVVSKLKRKTVTSETVELWERGVSSPSYAQLEQLAYKLYKRPLALFFFPEPPQEETPRQAFRTLPREEVGSLEPRLLYLVREARVMQENLGELFDGVNPAEHQVCVDISIRKSDSIPTVAKRVREYLGVGLDEQYAFKTNDAALSFWRDVVEEHGVFVFKEAFKDEGCSGFCLYDDVFPVIYINNSQPKIRQIFTLFHELAHLLFKTGGVDFRHNDFVHSMKGANQRIEMFCNQFAGEFLVPTEDIEPHLSGQRITPLLLAQLAEKYSVSREVVLRKCLDLNKVSRSFYKTTVDGWATSKKTQKKGGGNYYSTQGVYLGANYIEAAFGKFYQGGISKGQLADYLGVKESHVNTFENRMLSRGGAI